MKRKKLRVLVDESLLKMRGCRRCKNDPKRDLQLKNVFIIGMTLCVIIFFSVKLRTESMCFKN
jgi:hypothetical protein